MLLVYGIPNCHTVKKSLEWLKSRQIDWEFHDYKKKGITVSLLKKWVQQVGWEALLNKKGTTWRGLDEDLKAGVKSAAEAIPLMKEHTSLIRRPVIEKDGKIVVVGFDAGRYEELFGFA